MFRANRKELETLLNDIAMARWHDACHANWMSNIIAVLIQYASRARGTTTRSHKPSEKIVWTIFQCVNHPSDERDFAQKTRDFFASVKIELPKHLQNEPTPEQQAEDAAQLNSMASRLLSQFGVQKAAYQALLRLQALEEPFFTEEFWQTRRDWIESEFFASVM